MLFLRPHPFIPAAGLVILWLFGMTGALGRQADTLRHAGLSLRIDGMTESVSNSDIIGMTLALVNVDADSLHGNLQLSASPALGILGNHSPSFRIAGQGTLFLPVKLQVAGDAKAGQHELVIRAMSLTGELLAVATTVVDVQPTRSLRIQPLSTQELMRHVGDSLAIRVAVRNNGNTREEVKIVASYPRASGGRLFANLSFPLAAATDTTVRFGFVIDRSLMAQEHFAVHLTGIYANDEVFGNATVTVQNAAANRRYVDPSVTSPYLGTVHPNRLSFMVRNPAMSTQSWQLDGMGRYALGPGELSFNMFAYQWGEWDRRPVLNNTWVGYQTDRMSVTVGNVSESLETFLYGRGAKVSFSDSLKSEHIEFGVVERTFDLLGSDYHADLHNGFAAYFRTRLGEGIPGRKRYTGTAIYEHSPRENSENMLYMSSFDLFPQSMAERIQVVADIGPGLTRQLYRGERGGDYTPSLATGLQLHTRVSGFAISSTNYYSTGYYPGTRRGALQLNQRISRAIKRTNVWAGYSLYEYAPRYFDRQPFLQNRFLMSRAELGASFPVSDFASVSFSPLHEHESGQYAVGGAGITHPQVSFHAYRISTGLNWRARNYKQYGYLTLENGLLQSSVAPTPEWQARLNLSYSYDWLNVNINLQRGSFSLMELANNWYFQRDDVFRVGVSASARKEFFAKRLRTEAGVSYYHDSFSGENWTGTGRLQYAISPKTNLFALSQLYRYGSAFYHGSLHANVQVGVQQALPGRRSQTTPKKGNIELMVYHDNNRNGQYDEGDTPGRGMMVLIDNTVFIADADGKVQYRGVPYGSRRISVPTQRGWYAVATNLDLHSRRARLGVPLQQAGTVTGSIRFEFDARLSHQVSTALAGYTITATNATGFTARTITDSKGNYTLFLPAGNYEISILESKMPQHVYPEIPIQLLQVSPHARNEAPVFVLEVEERQVEIKRFSSP